MDIANVLDEDPDLARTLTEPRLSAARRDCRAPLLEVPVGAWDAHTALIAAQRGYGLLVLDGVLARRVGRTRRHGVELIGPGDVVRAEDADAPNATLSFPVAWRAVE